jgi:hypothetical protein
MTTVTPAWAQNNRCADDPRECVDGVDEDGKVDPKNEEVERTFSLPPLKIGSILDLNNFDLLPHLAIELRAFTVPKLGDFAIDFGVATSRAFVSLSWEFIPLLKMGPSIWAGYNVKEKDAAYGIGFTLLKF